MESLSDANSAISTEHKVAMCVQIIDAALPKIVTRELISGPETTDILLEARDALVFGLKR